MEWITQIEWALLGQLILVDLLLGGDNALIIAMACRNLDEHQRRQGVLWGTVGAIAIRVLLIAFFLQVLKYPFIKIVGAVLLLWIGVKLQKGEEIDEDRIQSSTSVLAAIKTIIVADLVMSLDNVIAITGAAQTATQTHHELAYVIFGLLFSVPIIIWGSTLLIKLIDRFPIIVLFGAGLLGWIAGGLFLGDPFIQAHLLHLEKGAEVSSGLHYGLSAGGALLVMGLGAWLYKRPSALSECASDQEHKG